MARLLSGSAGLEQVSRACIGRHHGTPTEKEEDDEEGGKGSLGPWTEDEEERGGG